MKNIKQILAVTLSAVAVILTAVLSVSALDSETYDLNGDGRFDVLDVTYLQMGISGSNPLTEAQSVIADYNGDGKIDVLDVTKAQMLISGTDTPTVPSTQPTTQAQPTTQPQSTTSPSETGSYNREFADKVIELVNIERAKEGLSPLVKDETLTKASDIRSKETVTLFSHQRPDGSSCFTILQELNVPFYWAGENIAAGQTSPADVVQAWMESPPHYANIMNADANKISVSCYVDRNSYYGYYWQQFFAAM